MAASRVCMKRLGQDYQNLCESPLVGVSAAPLDTDLTVWHINFDVELQTTQGTQHAILHAILHAPNNYPQSPPNVGFCIPFTYTMGASYTDRKPGPLQGTMVLCLNILGNFANVHTEWKAEEGEGWSPSMSIETVLVQLQSMLASLDNDMSDQSKLDLVARTKKYTVKAGVNFHTYEKPWPALVSQKEFARIESMKSVLRSLPKPVQKQAKQFMDSLNPSQVSEFSGLMTNLMSQLSVNQAGDQEGAGEIEDDSVRCYVTKVHFSEELLGYGVYVDKKQLKTPGDLLSKSSFYEDGVRLSSTKKQFTHFLPAFINKNHAMNAKWRELTMQCLQKLAAALPRPRDGQPSIDPVLDVLPNLINSMIVEIMSGDRAAAIAFFEALCSFWRTLRYFLFEDEQAQKFSKKAMKKLKAFCTTVQGKHKNKVPDVGQLLALWTCLTDRVSEATFVDAYVEESSLRSVMWWLDGAPQDRKSRYVFEKMAVGRQLFMFQMTVCRFLIQGNPTHTCQKLDSSCGRLPDRLELLQNKWKQVQPNIKTWKEYFQYIGASKAYAVPILRNVNAWCNNLISRCNQIGSPYVRNQRHGGYNNRRQGGYGRGGGNRRGYRRDQNYV